MLLDYINESENTGDVKFLYDEYNEDNKVFVRSSDKFIKCRVSDLDDIKNQRGNPKDFDFREVTNTRSLTIIADKNIENLRITNVSAKYLHIQNTGGLRIDNLYIDAPKTSVYIEDEIDHWGTVNNINIKAKKIFIDKPLTMRWTDIKFDSKYVYYPTNEIKIGDIMSDDKICEHKADISLSNTDYILLKVRDHRYGGDTRTGYLFIENKSNAKTNKIDTVAEHKSTIHKLFDNYVSLKELGEYGRRCSLDKIKFPNNYFTKGLKNNQGYLLLKLN